MITIDDKEYAEEDLNDQQKYLVAQVQDIQTKMQNLQFQLDQLSVAQRRILQSSCTFCS